MDTLVWLAVAAGLIWQGALIIWVAPLPSQLRKDKPKVTKGTGAAFQVFWLDQYAWIGIAMVVVGVLLGVFGSRL